MMKSEDVTNDEERIAEPEQTKSEIRTRSGRILKKQYKITKHFRREEM